LLARENQIDTGLDEGLGGRGERAELTLGEADVEADVAPVFEAELLEPRLESFHGGMAGRPRRVEDADAERPPRRRLGFSGQRPAARPPPGGPAPRPPPSSPDQPDPSSEYL